jgi:hypothetical protein
MAAWLNLFLLVGVSRLTEVLLGLIAVGVGVLNVKDFVAARRGPSLTIPRRRGRGSTRARVRSCWPSIPSRRSAAWSCWPSS